MKSNMMTVVGSVVVAAALFTVGVAQARTPVTAAEKTAQDRALIEVVHHGDDMWHGGAPQTNGLACGNCHPDGAAIGPQTFPKYQLDMGAVVPLRDMINWCIMVPLAGQALDPNGDDMKAMEAYAYYMSRGMPLNPGDNSKQYSPVKVQSGLGYPNAQNPSTDGLNNDGWNHEGYNPKNPQVKRPAYTN